MNLNNLTKNKTVKRISLREDASDIKFYQRRPDEELGTEQGTLCWFTE